MRPAAESARRAEDVLHWRNWTLPVKLVAVLLVPTLFALALGVLRIVEETKRARSYDTVQQAITLEDNTAALVADLGRERDAAAAVLAAGRVGDPGVLSAPAAVTEKASRPFRDAAGGLAGLDATAVNAYRASSDALSGLVRLRQQVSVGALDAPAAIGEYTKVVDALLDFDQALARQVSDPAVAGLAAGQHALTVAREQVARQHAILAVAITRGRIDATEVDAVRAADVLKNTALGDFRAAVSPPMLQAYTRTAGGADADTRDQLKAVALNRGADNQPLLVAAPEWDRFSTTVEDELTRVSQGLHEQVAAAVNALQDSASNAAGVASVILLLGLLTGTVVVVLVARSMLRPLRILRNTALDVAENRLPRAVQGIRAGELPHAAVEPVPVTTREEIGQVARAFDAVHAEAVRLATEQANLRSAFGGIFVNLSRRSQALVERQLRLIEQLEAGEEDPEALANLFQLDHLATRMRRNSENLLVLSGTELARRTSRPVPLVDVLRAAVSEVEQYQRVEVAPPPSVLVLGKTAGDLVHLVAELVENATSFSAPETQVSIAAQEGPDGSVVIEIVDKGVGMAETELSEANTRLADPPMVDMSASRRMGLFVVGRLASRHNIRVRLAAAVGGGVRALVTVPANAVLLGPATGPSESISRSFVAGLPLRVPSATPSNGGGSTPDRAVLAQSLVEDGPGGTDRATAAVAAAGPSAVTPAAGVTADGGSSQPAAGAAAAGVVAAVPPPAQSPASDLFTPAVAPEVAMPSTGGLPITRRAVPESLPFVRPSIEENTPIFDGLASAWFREQKPVPVPWRGDRVRPAAGVGQEVTPAADAAPGSPGSSPEPGTASPAPPPQAGEPAAAAAASTASTEFSTTADAGWQAASRAATPEADGVTAAGLPKRRPKAHLVPGAAGPAGLAECPVPSRSAENVRGRLASYQQGVLEGRHQRGVVQELDETDRRDDPPETADEESQ